ncbi:uncharacterized protein LOC110019873 [Phalaenopsis equestris]|uniref:uncharacterized protein LOC110019846 n=1 Tax=Phalaenopsis equestris TaxID=78828 RepID=UPI0009E361EF|nr:uncharacterized protein LOC110019846 [Phalaenopsis equestris]XP_020573393.1 uncharacterized protein LOC110019873 [Phalaenopsis equestris]
MEEFEGANEGAMERFLGTILPPKLEDAGLEDCALSIESIKEAFSRAASSLKSRVSFDRESGGCVQNPGPSNGEIPDKLLGVGEICPPVRPLCGDEGKEEESEGAKDDLVVIGAGGGDLETDRVVVVGGDGDEVEGMESGFGGKSGCTVDGELFPGKKDGYEIDGDLDEDEENKNGPILVEELI